MEGNHYSLLLKLARRFVALRVEDARLMLAEKITLLLGAIAFIFVCFMLALTLLAMLSVVIGELLSEFMSPVFAFLISAGIILIIIVIIVVLKKQLIINPIARFVSRLLLDEPKQ